MLHTAQAYADKADIREQHACTLAGCIHCPHLSQFWLSASLMSGDADKLLLWGLQPQLKQLLLMKQAYRPDQCLANVVTQHVSGAPASWLLAVRDIQPVSSMKLDWEVEVAAIKRALRDSVDQQKVINV